MRHSTKIITLGDQAVVSGANFLISLLLARALGVEEYGIFALAWMVILGASSMHQALIVAPLYSLYPKEEDKSLCLKDLIISNILFSLLVSILVWMGTTIVIWYTPDWDRFLIAPLLGLASFFYLNYDFLRREGFLQSKPIKILFADIVAFGCQPIFIFMMPNQMLDISLTILGIAVLIFIGIIILFFADLSHFIAILKTERNGISWRDNALHTLDYSKYLLGTSVLQWFSGNFFLIAAGSLLGSGAVGAVRIAQNIVGVLHILFQAMENIIPSRAAALLHEQGRKKMYGYFISIGKSSGVIVLVILIGLILAREPLITFLYGEAFLPYQGLLIGYCSIYLFVFIGTMSRFVIRTVEKNEAIFISYVLTTIFSMLFANTIIHQFGVYGVVIGLLGTQLITLLVFTYSLKSELSWIKK